MACISETVLGHGKTAEFHSLMRTMSETTWSDLYHEKRPVRAGHSSRNGDKSTHEIEG